MQNRIDEFVVFTSKVVWGFFCGKAALHIDLFIEFLLTHSQIKGLSSFLQSIKWSKTYFDL